MKIFCIILLSVLITGFIIFKLCGFRIKFLICFGPSMRPYLKTGDILILKKINPEKHKFKCGGIYTFSVKYGKINDKNIIKRLDHITKDGKLYFIGDNKKNSTDSRKFGAVPPRCVKYKLVQRIKVGDSFPSMSEFLDSYYEHYRKKFENTNKK